jgi:hypothetical protein
MTDDLDLRHLVADLGESVKSLANEVDRARHSNRFNTAVQSSFIFVIAVGLAFVFWMLSTNSSRTACQAVNRTNATLLQLIETSVAATPTTPPAGSTPAEAKAFAERQALSNAFVEDTRRQLAHRMC